MEVLWIAPIVREVSKTGFKGNLPVVKPLLEIGFERVVDIFIFDFSFIPLINEVTLANSVESVCESSDSSNEDDDEYRDGNQTIHNQADDPAEVLGLWQVGEYNSNPEEQGYPRLNVPEASIYNVLII